MSYKVLLTLAAGQSHDSDGLTVGTDLMAAGTCGHPRWRQSWCGGFTPALLRDEDAPRVLVTP